ncbi:MAG: hypothetical protein M1827_005337 [Pycnora praestabilis]|nr:MAG: hypothetical protein M1827_005337 [Pycnora praestabilis]
MSSPSSGGSRTTKRKRASTLPSAVKKSSAAELQQPSSRDASGEDAEDPIVQEITNNRHKKAAAATESANPPTKRSRKASDAPSNRSDTAASAAKEDPEEAMKVSEVNKGMATRSRRNGLRSSDGKSTPGKDEKIIGDDDAGKSMPPPQKAGLADPVGFHTNPPPTGRAVRVYADGVFDLFHLGHMRQLEQAKNAFPDTYLLVGVTGDRETHKRKGLTVLTGAERAETVRHCKWVDEVIEDCPWIVTKDFLAEHNIDYVAHDDLPYGADEGDDIYKPIKEQGKFLVTQRTEGVSTTGIITKIVRDYEKYIARQFKRGTSRQELNVSWLKKNELDLKRHVTELRESIRSNWSTTGQELGKELRQFWQSSRPASPARGMGREGNSSSDLPATARSTGGNSSAALAHLSHLDIPRPESPGGGNGGSDFAAGYSLGLIGGVRSWMTRSRVSLRDSQSGSPETSDEDGLDSRSHLDEKSPPRGRQGKLDEEKDAEMVDAKA